ncbi:unnamed protein product [Linum trigynum]|uniref:Uncharacterized protein n=1 Tax=Linum trigynum TaxID=586398 RepID=A0AAV2G2G1_9ROSI
MSLSSLFLTELFSEPNGSFSVPSAGTFPALTESKQKINKANGKDHPSINGVQAEGIDRSAAGKKRLKKSGQGRGSFAITIRKGWIWKPPDWRLALPSQIEQRGREVRTNRRVRRVQPVTYKTDLGQSEENIEPRAAVGEDRTGEDLVNRGFMKLLKRRIATQIRGE